ncbi:hypothetical protein M501DRAFT_1007261 [Patellaria atrata CBS 101060]|uniref:tRNA (guanine(37)-N1)-methyltransferase n=1 Tax=Patellaria atrata CBS 101060 TaxID=1346257 RepID=A0A9P4S792_9PEZI|nr:hypothetical protein M501DRAFT_1007261 [Patellaria atrata CBS 101060]
MFRPPVNRAMRILDRSFFQKICPISAARVHSPTDISHCKRSLERSKDILALPRLLTVVPDPTPDFAKTGKKCLLLQPEIKYDDPSSWSATLRELESDGKVTLIPYDLHLKYDYWTYDDIMSAIMPEDQIEDIPQGFSMVGHVAHLNLRELGHSGKTPLAEYKQIMADVLVDKNPKITTVINKIQDVGTENPFRTFQYEVLAGKDDLNVEVKEEDCTFHFDFAKVYWNPRLHTEHARMVSSLKRGEAVCDVMAGVGPFAIPAGKKEVFIWANDLNPDSFAGLKDAITRNKVHRFVRPFCEDGHTFIRDATTSLLNDSYTVTISKSITSRQRRASNSGNRSDKLVQDAQSEVLVQPKIFSHYIMNLPASALSFLPAFIGLYTPSQRTLFHPHSSTRLPMVHVYCFSTKSEDNVAEKKDIRSRISGLLKCEIDEADEKLELCIHDVRDVAPKKRMFCASFRLPEEVAFREV